MKAELIMKLDELGNVRLEGPEGKEGCCPIGNLRQQMK
jgi:hypothetical protein